MKNRNGFTLIETITTLMILGIAFTMTGVVIANMANAQNTSSSQYKYSEEIRELDNGIDKYVSFLSLNIPGEDGVSFSFNSISENKDRISFTYSSFYYDLYYNDGHLETVTNSGTGITEIDGFRIDVKIPDVTSFEFSYDSSLAILGVSYEINGREHHGTYIVRTLA